MPHIVTFIDKEKSFPGSDGANGGITEAETSSGLSVEAVRLLPFLQSHYDNSFLEKVCLIKIDTEGHDVVILEDLSEEFRPPVILIEWFRDYLYVDKKAFLLEVRDVILTLCNSPHMSGPGLLHASVGTPLQEHHGEGLRDIPAQLASHPAQRLC